MEFVFLKLLNMSIAAGWLILAVAAARLLLKRVPKWIACVLWGIVGIRLICPFSPESIFSLIPSAETISPEAVQYGENPVINSGITMINSSLNSVISGSFVPAPGDSVNPLHVWTAAAGFLWVLGLTTMLAYALISYLRLRHRLREGVLLRENIWVCDAVSSPFILGIIRPRIYLSSSMEAEAADYVIAHEMAHLKRRDYWWKPLGYVLLAVYWFNPLCWLAYILFCRDIEFACDEKAIKDMDMRERKAYSGALLSCNVQKRLVTACPLAFGEVGVKDRVKSVLNYRKPGFWVIIPGIGVAAVVAVCFLTNPITSGKLADDHAEPEDSFVEQYGKEQQGNSFDGNHLEIQNTEDGQDTNMQDTGSQSGNGLDNDMKEVSSQSGNGLGNDMKETGSQAGSNQGSDMQEGSQDNKSMTAEDAICKAILEHNASAHPEEYDLACCSFAALETLYGTPVPGSTTYTRAYYGWALYQEYKITEDGIKMVAGSHVPIKLSLDSNEEGYTLTEYWEPRDGSYFVSDIREECPSHIAEDMLDSQKFVLEQMQDCYHQAVQFSGLDTTAVIDKLLDTICSGPLTSSNPYDYIEAHFLEYRELTYYGEYSARYREERLASGALQGLEAAIMDIVCSPEPF